MKKLLLLMFLVIYYHSFSQQNISFEEMVMSYKVTKNKNVLNKNFEKGKYIFKQTINQIKNDSLKFNYIDYWNLSMSFKLLGEDKYLIKAFSKSYALNPEGACKLLQFLKSYDEKKHDIFMKIVSRTNTINCNNNIVTSNKFDIENYCKKNKLSIGIVKLIESVGNNDQKFRKNNKYNENIEKQRTLDSLNLIKIDSLYKKHHTYIGKSLVGNKFGHVMWSVIQHSNINKMEEYLPIILAAVKKKELKLTPLKMLIDRIHTIKCGNQIFGSQMGVDLAKEKVRKIIIAKYNIDSLEKL